MWETPIYKFEIKQNDAPKEIMIDVTGSAPSFNQPGKQLESALDVLLHGLNPSNTTILDFGAAKLRITLYLLEKGYTVYSCEFNDLFKRSKQANEYLKKAQQYPNFKHLVFPNDFIDYNKKFDVILLINVLNVMPVSIERLYVLKFCREKMKENGRLLWYTQHGAYDKSDAVALLNDGIVTGKGREYNMFYRDFSRKEIHDMLKCTGFSFNSNFKFPSVGNNQAYVFDANGAILVDSSLGLSQIQTRSKKSKLQTIEREARWIDESDDENKSIKITYETKLPVLPTESKEIIILKQYSEELDKIKSGNGKPASKYHQLIFNILSDVLSPSLKNPQKEEKINQGRKRVDITFDNKAEDGFFKDLKTRHTISCPYIFIECKNYTKALDNPEYDQIDGRLNIRRGMFGIITCRKIEDENDVVNHCRDLIRENPGAEKYVIVLCDEDIKELIRLKLENNQSGINGLFEMKLRGIIM